MRHLHLAACLLPACLPPGAAPPGSGLVDPLPAPMILEVSLLCDDDAGRWRVEVDTGGWARGGSLRWRPVGTSYVEEHAGFRSVRAAEDGTSDRLRLELSLVDDFRPAGTGGRTAVRCDQRPDVLVWVVDTEGAVADCVRFGPDSASLAALPDVETPECERVIAPRYRTPGEPD